MRYLSIIPLFGFISSAIIVLMLERDGKSVLRALILVTEKRIITIGICVNSQTIPFMLFNHQVIKIFLILNREHRQNCSLVSEGFLLHATY